MIGTTPIFEFKFETTAKGGNVFAYTKSAPINESFSLINSLAVKSAGKNIYEPDNIHKPHLPKLAGLFRRFCKKCGKKPVLIS